MQTVQLGKVSVEANPEETRRIYSVMTDAGTERCDCLACRNYRAQLPDPLPTEVMTFLRACGVDPSKDAEVYEMGPTGPREYIYGGEYYFIAKELPSPNSDHLAQGFQFWIVQPSPLVPEAFRDVTGASCFQFAYSRLPWILSDRP